MTLPLSAPSRTVIVAFLSCGFAHGALTAPAARARCARAARRGGSRRRPGDRPVAGSRAVAADGGGLGVCRRGLAACAGVGRATRRVAGAVAHVATVCAAAHPASMRSARRRLAARLRQAMSAGCVSVEACARFRSRRPCAAGASRERARASATCAGAACDRGRCAARDGGGSRCVASRARAIACASPRRRRRASSIGCCVPRDRAPSGARERARRMLRAASCCATIAAARATALIVRCSATTRAFATRGRATVAAEWRCATGTALAISRSRRTPTTSRGRAVRATRTVHRPLADGCRSRAQRSAGGTA